MRGVRSLIVLLVIAVPLGWYAYRESLKGPVDDSPKRDKLFTVEADKIDELQIKSEAGERTMLRKKGATWEIVQPTAAPPDEAAVSGITSNLASVEIQRVIDENASDLKEYGLVEPRIEWPSSQGGQERRLQIGQKTPSAATSTPSWPIRRRSSSSRRTSRRPSIAARSICATSRCSSSIARRWIRSR
jgi:hypothetical protein